MKKLLNTLYVTNEKAYLSLDGETIYVEVNNEKLGQIPLHTLESIVCFSYAGSSPALMGECAKRNINMAFYNPYGKFLCRVENVQEGNVYLRKNQYNISDDKPKSCLVARNFILGKVYNCKWILDKFARNHKMQIDVEKISNIINQITLSFDKIKTETDLDALRGIEGAAASLYFDAFDDMILNQKDDFYFHDRSRRPPMDNVNAMLSFGYSLLANDCAAALNGVGLDVYAGFIHRDRPGRKSLALDLMEELRPILVDRFVLTLINNRQIKKEHFVKSENGAVTFTDQGKKVFLKEWQEHKKEVITHPYLNGKINWGLVPHVQALLLARYLREDIDGYPPFLWR